ncbi:glycosyltransferase family 2 protein [Arthrobacter sp. BL-252-APC-1A]|nr:glycosyltransferase family 2 protein [Arthrobacter sp. BL-252-APC-1A]
MGELSSRMRSVGRTGQLWEWLASSLHPALRARLKRARHLSIRFREPDYGLVSVIVPFHNVAPYLDRCLRSLVGQSYSRLEIILVDDGSTDPSARIAAGYAR